MEEVFSHKNSASLRRNIKIGLGAFGAIKVLSALFCYFQAKREIAYRKEQLAKPVYELKGDELVTPPWNKNNIEDWLYRRVKITGRPIHNRACLVPRQVYRRPGYEYVVPLVTKESKAGVTQFGYMFSKGFIPAEFKDPGDRARIEETDPQTFTGFLSKLDELKDHGFMGGNSTSLSKREFTHSNLKDFAEASGLKNQEHVQLAVIERLEDGSTLDERDPVRYAHDSEYKFEYPYPKTLSGALQLAKMPWNYRSDALFWGAISAGAFGSLLL